VKNAADGSFVAPSAPLPRRPSGGIGLSASPHRPNKKRDRVDECHLALVGSFGTVQTICSDISCSDGNGVVDGGATATCSGTAFGFAAGIAMFTGSGGRRLLAGRGRLISPEARMVRGLSTSSPRQVAPFLDDATVFYALLDISEVALGCESTPKSDRATRVSARSRSPSAVRRAIARRGKPQQLSLLGMVLRDNQRARPGSVGEVVEG
jgi:hypothetical protein